MSESLSTNNEEELHKQLNPYETKVLVAAFKRRLIKDIEEGKEPDDFTTEIAETNAPTARLTWNNTDRLPCLGEAAGVLEEYSIALVAVKTAAIKNDVPDLIVPLNIDGELNTISGMVGWLKEEDAVNELHHQMGSL